MSSANFNSSGYIYIPVFFFFLEVGGGRGIKVKILNFTIIYTHTSSLNFTIKFHPLHNMTLFYKENECQLPFHPCWGHNNKITKSMFDQIAWMPSHKYFQHDYTKAINVALFTHFQCVCTF